MRKKTNVKKLFLAFIYLIGLLLSIYFIAQLEFTLKENSKVLKNQNLLVILLSKRVLVNEIFSKEPDVIKVNFKINFRNREIEIEKIKDEPVAIICYRDCFYLSKFSYIYKPKELQLNKVKIISANPVYENSYLLPELTTALAKIFEYSNLRLIPLKEIYILSNLDLKIRTEKFVFLIDPFKNVDQQLKKLSYFLDNYKKTPYSQIDLRIPQKIFFK